MCGIAGVVSSKALAPEDHVRVARMNAALQHRGPDGEGEYRGGQVSLAMRRLSIIDLEGGWQPLYNEDRSLVLIANGEIYNFVELKSQLQARGHAFKTGSDCETILHLYEEYGTECVHHLRGMFAFALWDTRQRKLILGRDRMGEKPLYLFEKDGRLIFASEIKALLQSGLVPFELDPVAVDRYFYYQYVPEPATPLRGVRKLAPGHLLTVTLDPWNVQETCYWRIEDAPPITGDPAELIRAELETISEIIVRSDVPVGVALSGGLDSSAIAALAVKKYPGTIHAFSIGYTGRPPFDERAEAQALANHLDIPFHDIELSAEDMVEFFPQLIHWRDDPIADISGYGYYSVMRAAREHGVPVMLQGQGGDELFWGYPWVRQAAIESRQKSELWRNETLALLHYLRFKRPERTLRSVRHWFSSLGGLRYYWARYERHRSIPRDRMIFYDLTPDFRMAVASAPEVYTPEFARGMEGHSAYDPFTLDQPWPDVEATITRLIIQTYLLENGIAQGDRLSMASSVELRLPLVDYRLVETVVGLRKTQSDLKLPPKGLFKKALDGVLPDWVMNRPKRGFQPPVQEWHRALFQAYGRTLEDGYLVNAGVLRRESARALAAGPFPLGAVVPMSFKALVLELWCRNLCGKPEMQVYREAPELV